MKQTLANSITMYALFIIGIFLFFLIPGERDYWSMLVLTKLWAVLLLYGAFRLAANEDKSKSKR